MTGIFIVLIVFFAIFGLRPMIEFLRERERLRYGTGGARPFVSDGNNRSAVDLAELDQLRQVVTALSDDNLELTRRMQRLEGMVLAERKGAGQAGAPPIDLSALGTEMSPEGDLTRSRQRLG